nr:MAG TPA: hypothetical protein [Caudoviricetes sp.]
MIAVSINFLFGGRKNMYKSMKTLITRKFYKTAELAQRKLDVFYAVNRLTDEEYQELTALVVEVYGVNEGDTPTEDVTE